MMGHPAGLWLGTEGLGLAAEDKKRTRGEDGAWCIAAAGPGEDEGEEGAEGEGQRRSR